MYLLPGTKVVSLAICTDGATAKNIRGNLYSSKSKELVPIVWMQCRGLSNASLIIVPPKTSTRGYQVGYNSDSFRCVLLAVVFRVGVFYHRRFEREVTGRRMAQEKKREFKRQAEECAEELSELRRLRRVADAKNVSLRWPINSFPISRYARCEDCCNEPTGSSSPCRLAKRRGLVFSLSLGQSGSI